MIRPIENKDSHFEDNVLYIPIPLREISICEKGDILRCEKYEKVITEHDLREIERQQGADNFGWYLKIDGSEISLSVINTPKTAEDEMEIAMRNKRIKDGRGD